MVDSIVSYLFLLPASSRPSTAPVMVPSAPSVSRSQVRVTSKSRAESWSFARRAWDRPGARIASSSEPPSVWSCPGAGMIRVREKDSKGWPTLRCCLRWRRRCGEMKLLESRIMCAIDAFGGRWRRKGTPRNVVLGPDGHQLMTAGPHCRLISSPSIKEPLLKCPLEGWCFAFCNYSDDSHGSTTG